MKKKKSQKQESSFAAQLNSLLAAYQVVYFNIRACHWLVNGENFFELHRVFETAYNDATTKIDEIAERILTLGEQPVFLGSELIKSSRIKERNVSGDETECVKMLLENLSELTEIEKQVIETAEQQKDIVTADLLTGYMGEQQKTCWMLAQFLNKRSRVVK